MATTFPIRRAWNGTCPEGHLRDRFANAVEARITEENHDSAAQGYPPELCEDFVERCDALFGAAAAKTPADVEALAASVEIDELYNLVSSEEQAERKLVSVRITVARDSVGDVDINDYLERLETAVRALPDLAEDAEVDVFASDATQYQGMYSDSPPYRWDDASQRLGDLAEEVFSRMCRGEGGAMTLPQIDVQEATYRPGDVVECLDASNGAHFLEVGKRFTVASTQRDSTGRLRLCLVGMACAWEAERFRKI